MAKPDLVIEQMNSFALALLVAAREAKVEGAAGATDHLSIAERVNVFREVAKWISIKNRLPEPAEGGDLDDYRARLGQSQPNPREQARVLVEQGKSIGERAITPAASGIATARPPAVGTPRRSFAPDGSYIRGNPSLRPPDEAGGGPDLDALRARLPSGSGGHAGGVRRDRGGEINPVTGRPRGLRGGDDGPA